MDVKDFRIGNLASFKGRWIGIISSLHPEVITFENNQGLFLAETIQEVPLTEEILTQFGFQERVIGKNWFLPAQCRYELFKPMTSMGYYRAGRYSRVERCLNQFSERFFYAHQLQNFHYAATKQELPTANLITK